MTAPSVAAIEIEQTLRIARDEVERRIARYRVWVFAASVAMTLVLFTTSRLLHGASTIVPPIYFTGCVAYALALHWLMGRIGTPPWLAFVSTTLDLVAGVFIFVVLHHLGTVPDTAEAVYPAHVVAISLAVIVMLNSLRGSQAMAIWCGVLASFLYMVILYTFEGFMLAQLVPMMLFWMMGGIGVATAQQGRRTLDNFARLQLLRRYLSPAAVERVMRENTDSALSLGGQLVTVTLLSADLRGFTAMSDALSPNEIVHQLNAFHGAMLEQIEAHEGVLDKFMGDGLLVVFGLERLGVRGASAAPDAGAKQAVACAHAMQEALGAHNVDRATRSLPGLKMGIGVHTGPVVAGNIGAPGRRLEFTVIGDAVNMASRLEGMTKEALTPVLVSSATVDQLAPDDRHGVKELEPMAMRGKANAIRVFSLV